jgi:hypothetical protein
MRDEGRRGRIIGVKIWKERYGRKDKGERTLKEQGKGPRNRRDG